MAPDIPSARPSNDQPSIGDSSHLADPKRTLPCASLPLRNRLRQSLSIRTHGRPPLCRSTPPSIYKTSLRLEHAIFLSRNEYRFLELLGFYFSQDTQAESFVPANSIRAVK